MWFRVGLLLGAVACGYALALFWPQALDTLRERLASEPSQAATAAVAQESDRTADAAPSRELVKLTEEQIHKAAIGNAVVIGGLLSATLLTLMVLPSLYVLFGKARKVTTSSGGSPAGGSESHGEAPPTSASIAAFNRTAP